MTRYIFLSRLEAMPAEIDPASVSEMRNKLISWEPLPRRDLGFQIEEHGSVRPNESALAAAGYVDIIKGPIKPGPGWQPY
ncbi:hypothetical protein, partial [Devosia sp.]|uniref:hypothetical protein n=1 Tax=Devosia sp. TaxID=1871048 RepID=UPI0037C024E1